MKAKVISVLLIGIFLTTSIAFSEQKQTRKFIPGCEEVGHDFDDGQLVLNPVKPEMEDQTIYFIQNISGSTLKLKSINNLNEYYPIFETTVEHGNWAVFATDKKGMTFGCHSEYYGETKTDCLSAIEVCQFPRAKFAPHNQGNYWVTSNKAKYAARRDAIKAGILLRW